MWQLLVDQICNSVESPNFCQSLPKFIYLPREIKISLCSREPCEVCLRVWTISEDLVCVSPALTLKGIFAYLNYQVPRTRKEIFETLVKGLQRLEYRGYDSAGKTLGFTALPHTHTHIHHAQKLIVLFGSTCGSLKKILAVEDSSQHNEMGHLSE